MAVCCQTHNKQAIFLCLELKCKALQRKVCDQCLESHSKHWLVSAGKFNSLLMNNLDQKCSQNEKKTIFKKLQSYQCDFKQQCQNAKNKLENLICSYQELIEAKFHRLYWLLSVQTASNAQQRLQKSQYSDDLVKYYAKVIQQMSKIHFPDQDELEQYIYTKFNIFEEFLGSAINQASKNIKNIRKQIENLSIIPQYQFQQNQFSSISKHIQLQLSDCRNHLYRLNHGSNHQVALLKYPIDPLHNKVKFKVQKQESNSRSIWLGVCIGDIVKSQGFSNCQGLGKGSYAIDQGVVSYFNQSENALGWNHHDNNFNHEIGFNFGQGDIITVEVNYDLHQVSFLKGDDEFVMPIKLFAGQLYAFAGTGKATDLISICSD